MSDADQQMSVELLVAELDGEIVGSVALFPAKSDPYKGLVGMLDSLKLECLQLIKSREEQVLLKH